MAGGGPRIPRPAAWPVRRMGVALVLALIAGCGGDGDDAAPETTSATTPVTSANTSTTAPAPAGARPLGSVRTTGTPATCPLTECLSAEVECPELAPAPAEIAIQPAVGEPVGMVVLFSGALGNTYWANPEQRRQAGAIDDIAGLGFVVAEVAWPGAGWGGSPPGTAVGFAKLACRSATVIRWLHDERYAPLGLDPPVGACGFCVSGNSGGASQTAYALAYYGLDVIIDVAVLTSGPPHADIGRGCLRAPGDEAYAYGPASLPLIDSAYGHLDDPGPCAAADPDFAPLWQQDSVATGGNDYAYDTTRVEFLLGGQDRTIAPAQARLFIDRLEQEGSPMVRVQEIPDMEHEVLAQPSSRDAVVAALAGDG